MKKFIHPLTDERVPINKALLAAVIELIDFPGIYEQDEKNLIYKLEEILEEDEVIDEDKL